MSRISLTKPLPTTPIPSTPGWRATVNGQPATIHHLQLEHPRIGLLSYGLAPGGYDGWSFHEEGGGGSVVVPYAQLEGLLHIGVVEQDRPFQGGKVLNVPRGFLEPGEDRRQGAARELLEEVGLTSDEATLVLLGGEPANPNSTFFETWVAGEGVAFFGVAVSPEHLEMRGGHFAFTAGVLDESPGAKRSKLAEAVGNCRFIPWHEAALVGDMFTIAAVARVLAHLAAPPRR